MSNKHDFLTSPIHRILLRMSASNSVSILAAASFALVDTFFISQLGTHALTAINFTHPITLMLISCAVGLGVALSTLLSRLLGEKNHHQVKLLFQHCSLIAFVSIFLLSTLCYFATPYVFMMLGAQANTLSLIESYLHVWYLGFPIFTLMILNQQTLRALGAVQMNAAIVVISALLNFILDPVFIFGFEHWDGLGIQGAALASVVAWSCSLIISYVFIKKHKLLFLLPAGFNKHILKNNFKRIYKIATPAALTLMLTPLMNAVLLLLLARTNLQAVAAFGTGLQIQSFVLIGVTALSSTLVPFLAQNLGANQEQRAYDALHYSYRLIFIWHILLFFLLHHFAESIATLFTQDLQVHYWLTFYLKWLPLGFAPLSMMILFANALNAYQKPMLSVCVNIIRSLLLAIPLALIGQYFFQESGIFCSTLIANIVMGVICVNLSKRLAPEFGTQKVLLH